MMKSSTVYDLFNQRIQDLKTSHENRLEIDLIEKYKSCELEKIIDDMKSQMRFSNKVLQNPQYYSEEATLSAKENINVIHKIVTALLDNKQFNRAIFTNLNQPNDQSDDYTAATNRTIN
ncbi:MAG: hypothetical protein AAGB12_13580 [Pseudomonadota bacterium]